MGGFLKGACFCRREKPGLLEQLVRSRALGRVVAQHECDKLALGGIIDGPPAVGAERRDHELYDATSGPIARPNGRVRLAAAELWSTWRGRSSDSAFSPDTAAITY